MDTQTPHHSEEDWKEKLSQEQYQVLRQSGTESPFTGKYYKHKEDGMYVCGACNNELFSSNTKFESGSGWPSFTDPINKEHIILEEDSTHGMVRTEVRCKHCNSHLGHVFPDGPGKSVNRFCINSIALDFKPKTE